MNWQLILENLRTEAIFSRLAGTDPLSLAHNPHIAIPFLVVLAVLALLKMVRTLVTVVSAAALWFAVVYTLPKGEGFSLKDLGVFISICIMILAFLIYVYLIRSD
ncbi:MAG: hypothetical protein ACP5J5_01360 [Dissulfurimicrobium sp.]|nr:hypothetical protein [Dissulfurimicrobium hydrothermale]UKL13234.1 hypothetical protein LGS26_07015 [Dissulfurimicrobium hydrothermale]